MGFNGVRKHQKIEDPRYLYWADRLGLLVWEEMPSAYRFTQQSVERVTREWMEAIDRDYSHPCIIAWVPFNESWGVPNLPDSARERHYVQALYHLTKTLDPTRPVIGNDGWESVATDIIGIHDYDDDPERIARALSAPTKFCRGCSGANARAGACWCWRAPHDRSADRAVRVRRHRAFVRARADLGLHALPDGRASSRRNTCALLDGDPLDPGCSAGFCYTQFADTYQEANGLLHADRTPKIPIEEIAVATRGRRDAASVAVDPIDAARTTETETGA